MKVTVTRVQEIELAIESLSPDEYARLRDWFAERDWAYWDRQIEADSATGKLDFLIQEALTEKTRGQLTAI